MIKSRSKRSFPRSSSHTTQKRAKSHPLSASTSVNLIHTYTPSTKRSYSSPKSQLSLTRPISTQPSRTTSSPTIASRRVMTTNLSRQHTERIDGIPPSIFAEMTALSMSNGSVNLGQGAPDIDPKDFIKQAASEACFSSHHQYSRSPGAVPLVTEVANLYGKTFGRKIDPLNEVSIGVGATEVGYSAFVGLVNPGDEVVLFEPFFDCYSVWAKMVDATPRFVPLKHVSEIKNPVIPQQSTDILRSNDWTFDKDELEAVITDKTRILLLNTPHNPLGKVFSLEELEFIASLVRRHPRLVVVSDEVYDFLIHHDTGIEHVVRGTQEQTHPLPAVRMGDQYKPSLPVPRFATLEGMWDQTLTLGSAGKTFSITGWKLGWAIGPKHLVSPRSIAHQWITFSVAAPLQLALSNIIKQAQENGYFDELANDYTRKRDALYTGLYKAGLNPILSSAGYFIVVDGQNLVEKLGLDPNDSDLGKKLAVELSNQVGVTSIPVSEFYSEAGKHHGRTLLRFAYCKQDHVIESGINKLLESDILKQ